MKNILALTFVISLSSNLVANEQEKLTKKNDNILKLGVVPQQSASKLAIKWIPFCNYLSKITGMQIEYSTAPSIPEFESRLSRGEYDIAYMNPYHFITFHDQNGYKSIGHAKEKLLRGILVVAKDSKISSVQDLNKKDLAFPSPLAFAASIIVRSYLRNNSIEFVPKYVSSHDSVYRNVEKGLMKAGGGVMRTYNMLDPTVRSNLKIIWTSPGYTPHAFAYHPRISQTKLDKLRKALLELELSIEGKKKLDLLNIKGIQPAQDSQWNDIRSLNIQKSLIPNGGK